MANFVKFILILGVALSLSDPVWGICDTLEHIDKSVAMVIQFFGNRDQKALSTEAAYNEDCGRYEKAVQTLTEYITTCLTSIPADMGSVFVNSIKAHYDKRCKDSTFAAQFREHNKCFEDGATFEKFHQCSDRWYHQMQNLKGLNQDVVHGIQSSCCLIHDFQRCVRDYNTNLCHDKNARFWDDVIDEVTDDHRDKFCANLKTAEQCDANFPKDTWAALTENVKGMDEATLKSRPGKFISVLFTVIEMAAQYKL